ncbi:pilus assembly protein TadG-related protein [Arthrobacter sp. Hz1]
MRRIAKGEDGAVAVMTALFMVLVLGMTAIVIDIGMLYAERAQLQNGADAAALAIAQDCAEGSNCNNAAAAVTAMTLASANANDGFADASPRIVGNTVTVQAKTLTADGEPAVQHWFAPILGIDETVVGAKASASWGSPTAGQTAFPLAFSVCQVKDDIDGDLQRLVSHGPDANRGCNYGPSGQVAPGGFGWLEQDSNACGASIDVAAGPAPGRPGNSAPADCDDVLRSWATDISSGKEVTVLLPIFVKVTGSGNNTGYHLTSFAAFQVVGWKFSGGSNSLPLSFRNTAAHVGSSLSCTGGCRGIIGKFVEYVSLEDNFTIGPPTGFGATIVKLTG